MYHASFSGTPPAEVGGSLKTTGGYKVFPPERYNLSLTSGWEISFRIKYILSLLLSDTIKTNCLKSVYY